MNDTSTPHDALGQSTAQQRPPLNRQAVISLVLSFFGLAMVLPIVGSVFGIILGRRAVAATEESGERGGGAAQAAVVFGWFGVVTNAIVLVFLAIIVIVAARSQS